MGRQEFLTGYGEQEITLPPFQNKRREWRRRISPLNKNWEVSRSEETCGVSRVVEGIKGELSKEKGKKGEFCPFLCTILCTITSSCKVTPRVFSDIVFTKNIWSANGNSNFGIL